MQLTISKKNFLKGLARAQGVADRKSSMPILSNILMEADAQGALRLSATDLYLGVSASVEAKVKSPGTVAVAARTLFDIVKNLPEGEVSLSTETGTGIEIKCGKVRYKIPTMPGDDFPPLPNPGDAEFAAVEADKLLELVSLTSYSMSSDDTRPHLAGALFEGSGKVLRVVTTDGHRLTKAEASVTEKKLKFEMLVPNKGVQELRRLLEDAKGEKGATVDVATASGTAFFRRDGVVLNVKLADEKFPPWAKVIPQQQSRRVVVLRSLLADALKRIALVASDKSGGVRLAVEPGLLKITSENPDVGEGSEELEVDFAGQPVTIGFNAKYVLDVLSALPSDEVALELNGELDPGVIKPANSTIDFIGVIMPMRI